MFWNPCSLYFGKLDFERHIFWTSKSPRLVWGVSSAQKQKNLSIHNRVHVFDQMHLRCLYRNTDTMTFFSIPTVYSYVCAHTFSTTTDC